MICGAQVAFTFHSTEAAQALVEELTRRYPDAAGGHARRCDAMQEMVKSLIADWPWMRW
jgi:hypothetical protein